MLIATQIQLRQGTKNEWIEVNPILAKGEPGYETDTNKLKFGDGVTPYISLSYFNSDNLNNQFGIATNIPSIFTGYSSEQIKEIGCDELEENGVHYEVIFERPFNQIPLIYYTNMTNLGFTCHAIDMGGPIKIYDVTKTGFKIKSRYPMDEKATINWMAIG